ncbi:MAG: hypothetical protein IJ227_01685, partial [Mogibacterium sp.]|nr:hypothetical protein [Mogibacterium sp.]
MTINQMIAFCLVAVLVAFIVVLAILAKHAIELMKKTKGLVGKSNEAVDDVKSRFDKITDGALEAVKSVAADSSGAVKAVAAAGAGLTVFNLIKGLIGMITGSGIIFSALSARKERKRAKKEIKLSKKTIKQLNKQSKAEKKAFRKANKTSKKLRRKEAADAVKSEKVRKAAAKAEAKILARTAKAEVKAAAKTAKAEVKAAAKTAKAEA